MMMTDWRLVVWLVRKHIVVVHQRICIASGMFVSLIICDKITAAGLANLLRDCATELCTVFALYHIPY